MGEQWPTPSPGNLSGEACAVIDHQGRHYIVASSYYQLIFKLSYKETAVGHCMSKKMCDSELL